MDMENALKHNDVKAVQDLLGRGADVNSRDHYGQTALMLAAHAGHRRIVETLFAHRANFATGVDSYFHMGTQLHNPIRGKPEK